MRESSHIWAPPIFRRLLSTDKRERDISERCLLKIRPTIIPPPPALSKV
jgi:telomere-associated protein RIF1